MSIIENVSPVQEKTVQLDRLVALLGQMSDREGANDTAIVGTYISKFFTTQAPRNSLGQPVLCIVAQGAKTLLFGDQQYSYNPGNYLLMTMGLPIVSETIEASHGQPCLSLSIQLDFAEIGALIMEAGLPEPANLPYHEQPVLFVNPLNEDLLDAVVRFTNLLKTPAHIPILAPLVRREIFYKLLLNDRSGQLRQLASKNSQMSRIAAGVEWLKRHATQPVSMEELAQEVNMSPSTMYTWFKSVMHMSPLQFQKQLRLQEARRILFAETTDVTLVSQRVGYESASQFSREYRRLFGLPPLQDIKRLRTIGTTPNAPAIRH